MKRVRSSGNGSRGRWISATCCILVFTSMTMNAYGQADTTGTSTPRASGWVFFTEEIGIQLGLERDVTQRLRDLDGSLQKEYNTLGHTPTAHPRYEQLTTLRAREVRKLLTPEQYTEWDRSFNPQAPLATPKE